jgi:hypothetical protein
MTFEIFGFIITLDKVEPREIINDPFWGPIQEAAKNFHDGDNFDINLTRDAYREREKMKRILIKKLEV